MSVQIAASSTSGHHHTSFLGHTIEEKTRSILGWTSAGNNNFLHHSYSSPNIGGGPQCRSRKDGRRKKSLPNATAPYHIVVQHSRAFAHQQSNNESHAVVDSSTSAAGSNRLTPPSSPSALNTYNNTFNSTNKFKSIGRRSSFDGYQQTLPISPVSPNTPCPNQTVCPTRTERENQVFERLRQLVPVLPRDRNAYQVLIETVANVIDLEHQLEELNEKTEDVRSRVGQPRCSSVPTMVISTAQFPHGVPDDLMSVDVTAFKSLLNSPSPASSAVGSPASSTTSQLTVDTGFAVA